MILLRFNQCEIFCGNPLFGIWMHKSEAITCQVQLNQKLSSVGWVFYVNICICLLTHMRLKISYFKWANSFPQCFSSLIFFWTNSTLVIISSQNKWYYLHQFQHLLKLSYCFVNIIFNYQDWKSTRAWHCHNLSWTTWFCKILSFWVKTIRTEK